VLQDPSMDGEFSQAVLLIHHRNEDGLRAQRLLVP
jgi:hypothetical protein